MTIAVKSFIIKIYSLKLNLAALLLWMFKTGIAAGWRRNGGYMKRIAFFLTVGILIAGLAGCGDDGENYTEINSSQNSSVSGFSVRNDLGKGIKEFYVSQNNQSSWGENLLGSSSLDNGSQIDIEFSGAPLASKVFDIAIIMEDDTEYQFKNIDSAAANIIKLRMDTDGPVADRG